MCTKVIIVKTVFFELITQRQKQLVFGRSFALPMNVRRECAAGSSGIITPKKSSSK